MVYGSAGLFEKRLPELYVALQDRGRFQLVAELPGYEPHYRRTVLEYRSGE